MHRMIVSSPALRAASDWARLLHVVGASPAILYCCGASVGHGTTFISANVRDILGYAPDDVVSDPRFWADRVHPDDDERVTGTLDAILDTGNALLVSNTCP